MKKDRYHDFVKAALVADGWTIVQLLTWDFYIGGYQSSQKWLKCRKGRELSFEDIWHYQRIIVALSETGRIMKEVDKVGVE